MNQKKTKKPAKGFTLIEVLITIIIVGISMTSIMMLQQGSFRLNTKANRTKVAAQMIERQVEELRIGVLNNPASLPLLTPGTISENGVTLTWNYAPAVLNGNPVANARMVKMEATWNNSGKPDTFRISTAIAQNF